MRCWLGAVGFDIYVWW